MTVTTISAAPFRGAGSGITTDDANNTFIVPAGKVRKFLMFNYDIKTSAQAGVRFVGYQINDPGGKTFAECLTPAIEKISQLYGVCGFIGAPYLATWAETTGKEPATWGRTFVLPLPNIWLPAGFELKYTSPAQQSEDTFPIFRTMYEDAPVTGGAA